MRSSISSSEAGSSSDAGAGQVRSATFRATIALLAAIVAVCAVVEVGTRLMIHELSNTQRRIRQESTMARSIAPDDGTRDVLIVGNSLLIAGVDIEVLNEPLQPTWRGVRFGLEQTMYYDWYYGLKRLTTEGARPGAIAVCFEPRHLLGSGVRSEIFAHYLMRMGDTLHVSRELDFTPSQTADLFLANISAFWGLRKEIRKNVLGHLMPELPQLTRLITRGGGWPSPPIDDLLSTGRTRLEALRATTDAAGAKLILVLMPPVDASHVPALRALGEEIGVPIVMPLTDQDLQPSDYGPDQYHLSSQGRLRFTRALATALLDALQ